MTDNKSKSLYRDKERGKLGGVCAGIAKYFNSEVWLVRVVTISVFLLGGSGLIFIAYLLLWMVLDVAPKPRGHMQHDASVKKSIWQSGDSAKNALRDVNSRFRSMELKLQRMERHVTSDDFELKRQIDNLK